MNPNFTYFLILYMSPFGNVKNKSTDPQWSCLCEAHVAKLKFTVFALLEMETLKPVDQQLPDQH